jgi:GTP-binding protein
VDTLFDLRNKKTIIAKNGDNGQTQNMSGRNAFDIFVDIPLGTTIYDVNTNEVICDILESGQKYIICKGGRGGHGNTYFKSSFNRVPTLHENGDLGEEKQVLLKLKYVADVGLVGLPNAGKSTLISKISNATPKIASYQFTTLTPVLGTVNIKDQKLVFEDVPGLIEGASSGKGLGHEFLKHIERCHILIHLISLSASDNDDIVNAYQTIVNELNQYSVNLQNKPIILVGNKIDTDDYEENLKVLEKKLKTKIFTISAKEKINVDELLTHIYDKYSNIIQELKNKVLEAKEEVVEVEKIRRKDEKDDFYASSEVFKVRDGVYEVKSDYLEY